eukprot:TRINITY_DN1240_c0_g1_i2.p1 TRINITY_DN1240_c0_g1~~TRINITY_DN1240_c0_g1_i2.p1  ORF type:complete len:502 (+),score=103.93 TRINITY_DN1240_c0_g1_i2:154-1659(+)
MRRKMLTNPFIFIFLFTFTGCYFLWQGQPDYLPSNILPRPPTFQLSSEFSLSSSSESESCTINTPPFTTSYTPPLWKQANNQLVVMSFHPNIVPLGGKVHVHVTRDDRKWIPPSKFQSCEIFGAKTPVTKVEETFNTWIITCDVPLTIPRGWHQMCEDGAQTPIGVVFNETIHYPFYDQYLKVLPHSIPPPTPATPDSLVVCTAFRNQAHNIREWLSHHHMLGVQRFYLYDQGSTDAWTDQIRDYMQAGVVHITPWRFGLVPSTREQKAAFMHCLKSHGDRSTWMTFIDIDEFFGIIGNGTVPTFVPSVPVRQNDTVPDAILPSPMVEPANPAVHLPSILDQFKHYPGVMVDRVFYGPYPHKSRPEGSTLENYTRRQKNGTPSVKSIVQPSQVMDVGCGEGVHTWIYTDGSYGYDTNGYTRSHPCGFSVPPALHTLRLSHYWMKSHDDFELDRLDWDMTQGQLRNWTHWYHESASWKYIDDLTMHPYIQPLANKIKDGPTG